MGKRKSSRLWIQARRKDQFYKLAKIQGYRSRASFKLLEAIKRYRFMRPSDRVVDLGAAPGGWLQATRQTVGDKGFVYGFDLESIEPLPYNNVYVGILDVVNEGAARIVSSIIQGKVDVVLSDVAPKISGVWEVDHARQIFLARRSLEIADHLLRKGGNFFVKLFHGPELREFRLDVEKVFKNVTLIKPSASRARSSEVYLLGTGFLG